MRLYSILLASAVGLLATASASDCDAGTYPPEASTQGSVASFDSSSVDDTSSQAAPGIVRGYSASASTTGSNDDASAGSTGDDTTSGFGDVTQTSVAGSTSSASTSGSNEVSPSASGFGDVTQYSTAGSTSSTSSSGSGDFIQSSTSASDVGGSAASTSGSGDVTQSSSTASGVQSGSSSYPDEDGNKWGKDDANLPSSSASNVDASAASTSGSDGVIQYATSAPTIPASTGSSPSSAASNVDASASSAASTSNIGDVPQNSNAGSYPDEDSNKWGKDNADFPSTAASTSGSNDDIQYSTAAPTIPASTTPSNVDGSPASSPNTDDVAQTSPSDVDASSDHDGTITEVPVAKSSGSSSAAQTTQAPTVTTATPVATQSNTTTTSPTATSVASNGELCAKPRVRITDVNVGATVENNEDEVALKVVAIASLPSGGSRIAFQSGDSVIVRELDANDELVSSSPAVKVPLKDFADLHADENGFVILGTRDAEGGGTLNCGNPSNLCGSAPSPAVPCYDMYMIRYDGSTESWATKLTSSSASLPPYSSSKTGPDVYMIWWYAHHGRIAFDGKNWAAYFGAAISTSEGGCINIHQGDRMKVVDASGAIVSNSDSFDWGCSHSGYERITYDNRTSNFATICKTDNNNRIMPPNNWGATIYPVDLAASNLGDIVPDGSASSKKYWATVSNGNGDNAAVHLIHFALDAEATEDIKLGGTDANERAPHLASIGNGGMLAMWEGSSSGGDLIEGGDRTIYAQVLDSTTGKAISEKVTVDKSVVGNRYQALKTYQDGSVAYLSKGKTDTSVQVVRFYGC